MEEKDRLNDVHQDRIDASNDRIDAYNDRRHVWRLYAVLCDDDDD